MQPLAKSLLGSALAVAFFGASTFAGAIFERNAPAAATGGAADLIYLPTPHQARLMSLGYSNLVADYYWVKALQYFMDPTQANNRYKNLGDYLEIVIGVDPDYEYAYKFAGLAIPFDIGRFHHVNTKRSTSFLERGVKRFPANWQLHFLLGFNYLNFENQPTRAAEELEAAAKLPGSPPYLKAFAARVYAVGGDLERALLFANGIVQTSTDPEIVAMMKARVVDLEVERELRRIEAAAKAYEAKTGKLPANLEALIGEGMPPPPVGYSIDEKGVAHSIHNTERMELHQDPRSAGFRGE